MTLAIPEGSYDSPGPCWIATAAADGTPMKPLIVCRCGAIFGLGLHHVHADGRVTASFYHPEAPGVAGCADSGPGCGFHEFLILNGYTGPAFAPGEGQP